MPLRALLIDLDGTLADSLELMYQVYLEFLDALGHQGNREEFAQLNGPTIGQVVRILRDKYNLGQPEDQLLERYHNTIVERYGDAVPLRRGAEQLFSFAQKRGLRLALVTSAHREVAQQFLGAHNLTDRFEHIITGDEVSLGKPDPAIYQLALERLKLKAAQAVALEDSHAGLAAAEAAGISTITVEPEHCLSQIVGLLRERYDVQLASVSASFEICVGPEPFSPPSQALASIETIWAQEKKRLGDKLFNGPLLVLDSVDQHRLHSRWMQYKHYMAGRQDPELFAEHPIMSVGVSGMVISGEHVLLAKRSCSVATYSGFFELAPSGCVDEKFFDKQAGRIDYAAQLLGELVEETGIGTDHVRSLRTLGFAIDKDESGCDICMQIEVDMNPQQIRQCVMEHHGGEYESFHLINRADLATFIHERQAQILPTSMAILRCTGWIE